MKAFLAALVLVAAAVPSFGYGRIVPDASYCSNAGDEVARPVFRGGKFVGYECVQDNRGGGNGG